MSAQEEWRPALGFLEYEVSSLGRVRSHRRCQDPAGRLLGGWLDKKGYRKVFVYDETGRVERFVHVLVAEAFHGARPAGCTDTRHLNGDKSDNRPENLRFGSRSENELDKVRHGAHHNARKTHCKHGHRFSPENTHITPRGERDCKACRRDRSIAAQLRAASVPTGRAA